MESISMLSVVILLIARITAPPSGLVELPAFSPADPVYRYTGHTLEYNNVYHNASWVAYELTAEETETISVKRASRFVPDSEPSIRSAQDSDYYKSGFDRGHLAPSADMRYSAEAMRDCFLYSNISPQHPRLNRGIWLTLENRTRGWASQYGAVFIVAGPLYSKEDKVIGENRIRVPAAFYKVLLDLRSCPPKGIGFLFPNSEEPIESLASCALTIDDVEALTGIDFFPLLPDAAEALLESSMDPSAWLASEKED